MQLTAFPVTHSVTDRARECVELEGILKEALLKLEAVLQTCWQQDGAQYPLPLRSAILWRTKDVLVWYCSMQVLLGASHFSKDALAWQAIPRMQWIDQESYMDSMAKRGTLMQSEMYSANMHFHFSVGLAATHSAVGGSTSSFDIFIKFWNNMRQLCCFVLQSLESRKMPESGSDHTLALGARSAMQLVHKKVASPPADCPVTTISVALEKSWWDCWMELSWAVVTLWPRKWRGVPLQLIASFLYPW